MATAATSSAQAVVAAAAVTEATEVDMEAVMEATEVVDMEAVMEAEQQATPACRSQAAEVTEESGDHPEYLEKT